MYVSIFMIYMHYLHQMATAELAGIVWRMKVYLDSVGDQVWCHKAVFVSGQGPSYDTAVTNDTFCDDYCVTDLCDKFTQYLFASQ